MTEELTAIEVRRLRASLAKIRAVVDQQAEDASLWAVYPMGTQPVAEAYLQQELRKLHAVIEQVAGEEHGER